ncbi:MAG: FhaA domain-containing protein [Actinomycetota bacterium]
MGIADDIERRLERAVDGLFSKAFRSRIQPAEMGRRLLREMEGGKSVSVGAVYVPNVYVIGLGEADHARFAGLVPTLRADFTELLASTARERRWQFPGPVAVRFEELPDVPEGQFRAKGVHDATAVSEPSELAGPTSMLRLSGAQPAREWRLEATQATIGRLQTCEIALDDPNVSRRHAMLNKRTDGWWIVDLGSTNGTLVNDALVKERRLGPGDRIRVGTTEFEYRSDDGRE